MVGEGLRLCLSDPTPPFLTTALANAGSLPSPKKDAFIGEFLTLKTHVPCRNRLILCADYIIEPLSHEV